MTRRQLRRHARRHLAAVILAAGLVLVIADAVLHVLGLGLVLIAASIAVGAYFAGQRSRPTARVTPGRTSRIRVAARPPRPSNLGGADAAQQSPSAMDSTCTTPAP